MLPLGSTALMAIVAAQPLAAAEKNVGHPFRWRPGGNVTPLVTNRYFVHAWEQEARPDCSNADYKPDVQPAGFGSFGQNHHNSRSGSVVNRAGATRTEVTRGAVEIPPGGNRASPVDVTASASCESVTLANAVCSIGPFAVTNGRAPVLDVDMRVSVEAKAARSPRRARAYAYAYVGVEVQTGRKGRNGVIEWNPNIKYRHRSASVRDAKIVDPIHWRVRDLVTGEVKSGYLLAIELNTFVNRPGAVFNWESNRVQTTLQSFDFIIDIPGSNTMQHGAVDLRVRNGAVVTAQGSGLFAGTLPPVGATAPLSFTLPSGLTLDYDLGDFNGHELEVGMDFDASAQTEDEAGWDEPALVVTPPDPVNDVPAFVTWSGLAPFFVLESKDRINPQVPWTLAAFGHEIQPDGTHRAKLDTSAAANRFYRLRQTTECALSIKADPSDVAARPGEQVSFAVEAHGAPALFYQWQASDAFGGFTDIPEATQAALTVVTTPDHNGTQYRCLVSNGPLLLLSEPATLRVGQIDADPPRILRVTADCLASLVIVEFNEPLDPVTASNPANYRITSAVDELTVESAELAQPGTVVLSARRLVLPSIQRAHNLSVANVSDLAGNVVPNGTGAPFACEPAAD
jgi:hypothetical protein